MDQALWFTTPSIIALIINVWILIKSNKRNLLKSNLFLVIFFIGIIGPNLIEFLTFANLVHPNILSMKLYYVFMLLALSSVFLLSLSLSGLKSLQNNIQFLSHLVYGIALATSLIILKTNLIISGFETTLISITRIPGQLYAITLLFFFFLLMASIVFLVIGSLKKDNQIHNKRCKILLLSFSPMLLSLISIVMFIQLGLKINATFVFPITTTFLMLALINTECREDLFKLLLKLPYTNERKSYQVMIAEIESFLTNTSIGQKSSLKNLTVSLEQHIVSMALDISNGSQAQAASLLNTSASSICRKKKLEKG